MLVLVTGSRYWEDTPATRWIFKQALRTLTDGPESVTFIAGGARGVDTLFETLARERGYRFGRFDANWSYYGRLAGALRNRCMLDLKPDIVLAFHDNLDESKGTKDCVEEARRRGIPVRVYGQTSKD